MRKTNSLKLGGASAFILSLLVLTTTTTSSAAVKPATEIMTEIVENLGTAAFNSAAANTPVQTNSSVKMADLNANAQTPPTAKRNTGLNPMRLRMSPRYTPEQLANVEKYRQAVIRQEDGAMKNLNRTAANHSRNNRFQVMISDDGYGVLDISKGQGGWPGYPITNTNWLKRPMSADMQHGLADIIQRCTAASSPIYFDAVLTGGDADIGKGNFEVECVPGAKTKRAQVTDTDLAHAYLASSDIPLERRQDNFQWMIGFAMFEHYVKTTQNATIAKDQAECVRIYTKIKTQYAFTNNHKATADDQSKRCQTTDFNWVRRRNNIPEVQ